MVSKEVKFQLGITATRSGLTAPQFRFIVKQLRELKLNHDIDGGVTLHQGCCVGGDEQITIAAVALGCYVTAHPPLNEKAFSDLAYQISNNRTSYRPKPYLVRNADIVDACELLIAAPKEYEEVLRGSGTWSTIRKARADLKTHLIVYPDGSVYDSQTNEVKVV